MLQILQKNGVQINGLRLGHIVMHAELDGIICSGARKGKQFTYALLEERAPQGFSSLETVLPADELERIVGDYKKLVAQDRETLLKLARAQ